MDVILPDTAALLYVKETSYFATFWLRGRTYNPVIGIAGVSCVPTTAKVAQKEAQYGFYRG
jgi:Na+-transporting methylmalonyl-CoA/oxaloacetate decarboxylase beta subunit